MRILVALVLVAALGGVGYLLLSDGDGSGKGARTRVRDEVGDGGHKGTTVDQPPPPRPLPDIAATAQADPFSTATQSELAAFVAECRRRGAEAVPLLLQLLAKGDDRKLQARWDFRGGSLQGFPSLRAAYLQALRSIEGNEAVFAMREVMRGLAVAGESYILALELKKREVGGWTDDLLRTALSNVTPAALDLRREMVRLAAQSDPEATAAAVVREMPRGDSQDDGLLLSHSLGTLPVKLSIATAMPLMTDQQVTYRAKGNLLRAVLDRPEPEVYDAMREEVLRAGFDEQMRIAVAYAAVNSQAFFLDITAHDVASASQDAAAADVIRRRFEERMRAAEELVSAALQLDLATSADMRAAAMRRTLGAHRKKFEGK